MKWLFLLVGILGLVLLQVSAIPAFSLLGVAPNILLVVLTCWAIVRNQTEAMVLVPIAGISIGLLTLQGIAESVAAFVPIIMVTALRRELGPRSEYVWALAVVIIVTMLHFAAVAISIETSGSGIEWIAAMTDRLVPSIITNLATAVFVYWLIRLPTARPVQRI